MNPTIIRLTRFCVVSFLKGSRRKFQPRHLMELSMLFFIALGNSLTAQVNIFKEDTITAGQWNEYNPSLAKNTFYPPFGFEWLVFERQTDDSSFIVAKKLLRDSTRWDKNELIISRSSLSEIQKFPAISSKGNYSVAAWQKRTGTVWNIYYSIYSQYSQSWSPTTAFTNDTLDNVDVHVQSLYHDSQFVFLWRNKNIIRINKYPFTSVGINDTIAISNDDSMDVDLGVDSYSDYGAVLYTIKKNRPKDRW